MVKNMPTSSHLLNLETYRSTRTEAQIHSHNMATKKKKYTHTAASVQKTSRLLFPAERFCPPISAIRPTGHHEKSCEDFSKVDCPRYAYILKLNYIIPIIHRFLSVGISRLHIIFFFHTVSNSRTSSRSKNSISQVYTVKCFRSKCFYSSSLRVRYVYSILKTLR